MSAHTLFVDDKETLVDGLGQWSISKKLTTIAFATSLVQAFELVAARMYDRVITDLVFEGEREDGITLLERIRRSSIETELILLTQKSVSDAQKTRLDRINALVIKKSALSWVLMEQLLSGAPLIDLAVPEEEIDVGELRLEHESLQRHCKDICDVNDLLTEDILWELARVSTRGGRMMQIGRNRFALHDLKREVLAKTPIGMHLIRLHHGLYRKLREQR